MHHSHVHVYTSQQNRNSGGGKLKNLGLVCSKQYIELSAFYF